MAFDDFLAEFRGQREAALRGLGVIIDLRQTLDRVESELAARARADGATWVDIGARLGISRQAAFMRHRAARVNETDGDSPRPFA
jgi:hypothetical protein